ncbi:glycoside hydrolase family protein [Pseudescherichia vulneris]|uniref:glycoside hydrolase family protein n=1 Tax=Pseudescherichia vulneris TaxID=566 RepID=UPI0028AB1488|nr:glycoside hydrolase family protein [Pseudescherichia vulneris]
MDLKNRLKEYEGTKEYQAKLGYFRNGRFWPYKDSLGFSTIGYGHLVIKGEDFSTGLTEGEADKLLSRDLAKAVMQVQTMGLTLPDDWNDFIIIMVFQLGFNGVLKFRKMLAALEVQNYKEAIKQAKDSLWYRQTPNRVNDMISQLKNK